MTSTGKKNSSDGNKVQRIIAKKYGGKNVRVGYDVIFPESFAEVKSFLSTYAQRRKTGRITYYPNYVKIIKEDHEDLKKKADEAGRMAIYVFVKKPRNEDGTEAGQEEWIEACMRWEDVDRVLKNPELTRETINDCSKWRGYEWKRHFYVTRIENFFNEKPNSKSKA